VARLEKPGRGPWPPPGSGGRSIPTEGLISSPPSGVTIGSVPLSDLFNREGGDPAGSELSDRPIRGDRPVPLPRVSLGPSWRPRKIWGRPGFSPRVDFAFAPSMYHREP
jgi:hypothetical protein